MFSHARFLLPLGLFLALGSLAAQEPVALISTSEPAAGWTFANGQEFPGAKGAVSVDGENSREGKPSLKLVGDFTKGGKYVVTGRKIDKVDIQELSFWVKSPDGERFTLRINDGSGQTHQLDVKLEPQSDWQQVVLPLERFFAKRGQSDAVTSVTRYESWGGAKDGKWHGPATAIYFLVSERTEARVRTLWLNDVQITPPAAAAQGVEVRQTVSLMEAGEEGLGWHFTNGPEFKGSTGALTVVDEPAATGGKALKLAGNFTGGGAYVAAVRSFKDLEARDTPVLRFKVKTANAASIGMQLVDASGQTHQRKGNKVVADGQWQEMEIEPAKYAGGEHWGGANDGRWHGPLKQLVFSVTDRSDAAAKTPEILLADIRVEAFQKVLARPPAFKADFSGAKVPAGWVTAGDVATDQSAGKPALRIGRTLEQVSDPASAVSPAFAAAPGRWNIGATLQTELNSPDSSYSVVLQVQCLGAGGRVLESFTVADLYGKQAWRSFTPTLAFPPGTQQARFQVQLHKTWGQVHLTGLSAAYLAPAAQKDDRISRVLFATAQLGNLLFPEDPRTVDLTVEATQPLTRAGQKATCQVQVRDYWGAEQGPALEAVLGEPVKQDGKLLYPARVDLASLKLETGRYYELQASITLVEGQDPFINHTSLAILPEAVTRKYKPEEVPFTSRNWDNRPPEYIRLADRLGVRICGLWGGWSSKPPYKAEAPGLDLCKELGMGWLTTTPVKFIEDGKYDHNETSLKEGVRNLITQYGSVRPLIINLGNEPHGTGEKVKRNVAGYKAVYEEVKRVAPDITVVATSVEPNEEYFKLGYGQYCDAFDFHIYESAESVRRTIGQYRELMKKYDCVKPIWSTELGLNSQGQTRRVVAGELYKKFATFFAARGENVSWFGLLYPDPDGKSSGSSGDSHNVFDSRYKRYAPRLDAIAYYNAVNAIAIKKFVAEQVYEGGVRTVLFRDRDGKSLQVLWKDKGGRSDVVLPLKGVKAGSPVEVVRIDGVRRSYQPVGGALTLSVSEDPVLVMYDGGEDVLPKRLEPAAVTAEAKLVDRETRAVEVTMTGKGKLEAPQGWKVTPADEGGKKYRCTPPANSAVREAMLTVDVSGGALWLTVPLGN